MLIKTVVILTLLSSPIAFAINVDKYIKVSKISERDFGINSCLILGVLKAESGLVGQDTHHPNGAVDTGVAQFNKGGSWMIYFKKKYGISHEQIRDNPYISVYLIGYVLKSELIKTGDMYEAISAYHRGFKNRIGRLGGEYANRVVRFASRFYKEGKCRLKNKKSINNKGALDKAFIVVNE